MARRYTANEVAGVILFLESGPPAGTTTAEWVALAERESGYDPAITNSYGAVGLWQVVARLHVARIARVTKQPITTVDQAVAAMKKPALNYAVAKDIYREAGWKPWSAGHTPAQRHVRAAAAPAMPPAHDAGPSDILGSAVDDPGGLLDAAGALLPDNPVKDVGTAIGALADAFGQVMEWVTDPNTWKRAAFVLVGGGLLWVGVGTIVKPALDPVLKSKPVKVAKNVVTKGAL